MTMKLDCPMDDCHASIEGETEEEVMAQVEEHAKDAHPDIELDDATVADLKSQIQRT